MSGKSYTIKYEVHCMLQNFFDKEMVVKNCMSELHAKIKLNDYCKNKYGVEFQCIKITSCIEKLSMDNIMDNFGDIFGGGFGDALKNKQQTKNGYKDLIDALKNKKK